MTSQDLNDISMFLTDLHFMQTNAAVGTGPSGNEQAVKYLKRLEELQALVKREAEK